MAPERSISPQEETILTPKMSVPGSPVAGTPMRDAQSPISILLAVAQSQNRSPDDDLTSLNWLHERDLLKGMNINPSPSNSINSTPVKYQNNNFIIDDRSNTSEYIDESSVSMLDSSSGSLSSPSPCNNQNGNNQRSKHPHNIPYDPLVHTNNKPPYSFSCLIFMAIEDSIQKALPVKEIYSWILDHFPYFKNAPTGWKNSVRHNLSLNKCFQKVEKAPNLGKGSLWTVDPQYKPNLIQALNRSPFHPCSTLESSSYYTSRPQPVVSDKSSVYRLPNPDLFPFLSRKLAATEMSNKDNIKNEREDSLDEVDAAAVMLSLKNGPRVSSKKEKFTWQVITTSPSQDHTYSAADNVPGSNGTPAEGEERMTKNHICRKIDFDDDEERRIKEGAETLLNLAGITARKRNSSFCRNDEFGKKPKLLVQCDINRNKPEEKPIPFKPRLLRAKRKENGQKAVFNNNSDEWVKHRRELERNQHSVFTPMAKVPPQYKLIDEDIALMEQSDDIQRNSILERVFAERNLAIMTRFTGNTIRYCFKCKHIKPDRAHHCSKCDICVLKMDHHCPWINNCVGFSNYKNFLLFLLYLTLYCLHIMCTSLKYLLVFMNLERAQTVFACFFLVICYGIFGGALFISHVLLVSKNETSLEKLRAPIFVVENGSYDMGCCRNFEEVFGGNRLLWFFPVFSSLGTGHTFPLKTPTNVYP